jgi:hypothetical protein
MSYRDCRCLRHLLLAAAVLAVAHAHGKAQSIIDFNATVDYHVDETNLQVFAGTNPNPPTVVHIVEPADIDEDLLVFDSSIVYMSGGRVNENAAFHDTSRIYLSGGSISDNIHLYDRSHLFISGVSGVTNELDVLRTHDRARITMTGGGAGNLRAGDEGLIRISGGDLNNNPSFPGEITLLAEGAGTIVVRGSEFNYPLGPIPETLGVLSGRLASGEPIMATFEVRDSGTIVLVPEPPSFLLVIAFASAAVFPWLIGRRCPRFVPADGQRLPSAEAR